MKNKDLFYALDQHLLEDLKPSEFLNQMVDLPAMKEQPFIMLAKLQETEQNPAYHPEGNVWIHTMLVVDRAAEVKAKSKDPRSFMWAALLHDIGKPDTTKLRKGKLTSYDHDRLGAKLAAEFLRTFSDDEPWIESVANLVRWHMQILFAVKDHQYQKIVEMAQKTDIREIALLGLCDRLGRLHVDAAHEKDNVRKFVQKCSKELNREIMIDI